ncbi:GWxTD domain-containing protein [bacterium]|nr:MAG: GWxTD domain-containing protein [bacterium]
MVTFLYYLNNMKQKILYLLFVSSFLQILYQEISFAQEKFYFNSDYSVFKGSDGKSEIELYFSFTQRGLTYVKKDDTFEAMANVEVVMTNKQTNSVIFDEIYGLQSHVKDTLKNSLTSRLIGQQNYLLGTGEYFIKLIGSDNNNKTRMSVDSFDVSIPSYDSNRTYLSSLQMATSIEKSTDKKSIFYKNGLEITPTPSLLFGNNLNTVHYYIEIYNLKKEFGSNEVFLVTELTEANSGKLIQKKEKRQTSNAEAYLEHGVITLDSALTGPYLLKIELIDKVNNKSIDKQKKIYVYNTTKNVYYGQADEKAYMQSEFAIMTEEQVNNEFDRIIYVRTSPENKEWEKLKTLDEKRKFLFNFWKRRDTNPETPRFEMRDEYFKRFKEANNKFKEGFKDGWKSDRGRIYVIYGPPSNIDRHFFENEVKNYEIWEFDKVEGGTMCVFGEIQTSGEGTYVLIHSTMRNEIKDPNWMAKLKK